MSISIRKLGDGSEVCQGTKLFCKAYSEAPWNEDWTETAAQNRLQELADMPGRIAIGAWSGQHMAGLTVGFTQSNIRGKALYIAEVVVDPQYQRKGLGRRLLDALNQEAMAEGHVGAWLVSRGEGRTAGFYREMSFSESETLRIFTLSY